MWTRNGRCLYAANHASYRAESRLGRETHHQAYAGSDLTKPDSPPRRKSNSPSRRRSRRTCAGTWRTTSSDAESVEEVQVEQIEAMDEAAGRGAVQQGPGRQPGHAGHLVRGARTTGRPAGRDHQRHRRSRSIPWELMRDPQSDSAIALRVQVLRARPVEPEHQLRARACRPTRDASGCSTSSAGRAAETTSSCAPWPTACCRTWAKTSPASTSPPCARPPSSNSRRN